MGVLRGLVSVLGRIMIATIFLLSAVGNKIPRFNDVAQLMEQEGVPEPKIMLMGAIAFLLLGAISVILGYWARVGAFLLLVFLAAATYFFHDFWRAPPEAQQTEMIAFMKNLALMGTMVFLIANGAGAWSLDNRARGAAGEAHDEGHDADDEEPPRKRK
jgi:putative oxidoreductase